MKRKDLGLNAMKRRVGSAARTPQTVTVGVHGDAEGSYDGIGVVEIANIHEFGLGVPQRSFIRAWVDEKREEIASLTNRAAQAIVAGKLDHDRALEQMGLLFVASIQKRMAAGIAPEKADGSVCRLIDTGVLRASIKHKVEK